MSKIAGDTQFLSCFKRLIQNNLHFFFSGGGFTSVSFVRECEQHESTLDFSAVDVGYGDGGKGFGSESGQTRGSGQ